MIKKWIKEKLKLCDGATGKDWVDRRLGGNDEPYVFIEPGYFYMPVKIKNDIVNWEEFDSSKDTKMIAASRTDWPRTLKSLGDSSKNNERYYRQFQRAGRFIARRTCKLRMVAESIRENKKDIGGVMKYILLIFLISGCAQDHIESITVACEKPYYSGAVAWVQVNSEGTKFTTNDGTWYEYPASVKCEVKKNGELWE